jgi:hypothetical protein
MTAWAIECLNCQKGKVHCNVWLQPHHVAVPAQWFSHIHVDLVGPLPASKGATYMFMVIDQNTRWFEVLPLNYISAKACAVVLIQGWIARYGVPAVITLVWRSQFTSALRDSLCSTLGIKHVQTTAYHPQANRLVERFHRRLKDAQRARLAGPTWTACSPALVLLGLHAAPREEDKISPAQVIFITPIVLTGQFFDSSANVDEPEFLNFQMNWVLPNPLLQGTTVHGLKTCLYRAAFL